MCPFYSSSAPSTKQFFPQRSVPSSSVLVVLYAFDNNNRTINICLFVNNTRYLLFFFCVLFFLNYRVIFYSDAKVFVVFFSSLHSFFKFPLRVCSIDRNLKTIYQVINQVLRARAGGGNRPQPNKTYTVNEMANSSKAAHNTYAHILVWMKQKASGAHRIGPKLKQIYLY